jgi:hypothetical protein
MSMENDKNDDAHRQKVFFVVTVARQIEGDIVSVSFEKCFSDQDKAEAYYKTLRQEPVRTLQTENGPIQFACERRIHFLEISEG